MIVEVEVDPIGVARLAYMLACENVGTDPIASENAVLSIGLEFLPECARAVLADPESATVEYYEWLTAEVVAGAEEAGQL